MTDRDVEPETEFEARSSLSRGHRQGLVLSTQVIVLGWCLWLAGAWGVALWFGSPVPAARWLIVLALMGLMLIWPAVRLSGLGGSVSAGAIAAEWLCLVLVLQAVVWPLRLVAHWRIDQALWLAGALAAWSLLTAALLAVGVRQRSVGPRVLAMAGCMLLVFGEPAAMAMVTVAADWGFVEAGPWPMRVSPLAMVWALVQPALDVSLDPWPGQVLVASGAAAVAWMVVALSAMGRRGRR